MDYTITHREKLVIVETKKHKKIIIYTSERTTFKTDCTMKLIADRKTKNMVNGISLDEKILNRIVCLVFKFGH